MIDLIRQVQDDSELVDQAKKALFYGKDKPEIAGFRDGYSERALARAYPEDQLAEGLKRLHTALGIRSEADEILKQELNRLSGVEVTVAEETDELGDLLWYAQLRARLLGKSLIDVIRDNVAKLEKRFPEGAFSEERARNPDKAAEAAEQAKVV
jgi:NTP pyrophosphatase (non-canonical NTP hydrolase)